MEWNCSANAFTANHLAIPIARGVAMKNTSGQAMVQASSPLSGVLLYVRSPVSVCHFLNNRISYVHQGRYQWKSQVQHGESLQLVQFAPPLL
jgi:hypothetical protein